MDESGSRLVSDHFASRLERIEMLGKPAPAISGAGVDGEKIRLEDMKGKVVLVNFWATWCPPCVAETPTLRDLQSRYKDKGFRILGVNLDGAREGGDAQQAKATVKRFLIRHGIDWPNVLESTAKGEVSRSYGVTEIPALFLVGFFFAQMGVLIGVRAEQFDDVSFAQTFVLQPLIFLGGVFYSASLLPEPFQTITHFNPVYYMIGLVRFGFLGYSDTNIPLSLLFLTAATTALFLFNLRLFNRGWKLRA